MIAKNASLARSHDVGGEGALEDDDAGPVGQRANQFGLQRAPVGARAVAAGE